MVILGIDPGTKRAGYGLIRTEGSKLALITAGTLKVSQLGEKALVLQEVHTGLGKLWEEYKPDILAIEKLFFAKNRKTAIAVAEARGVIILGAEEHGITIREYSPTEVKASITGYGGADKKAVLKMVRLILRAPDLTVIDDASDALALAIVAAQDPKAGWA